ncbi:MAG: GNAT family N-acetyltransferase, partial [Candidatus Binataceae bacterium]
MQPSEIVAVWKFKSRVADVTAEVRSSLDRRFDRVFGDIPFEWAPAEWYATAHIDGRLAGALVIVTREITAGDQLLRVAGIGDVVTRPEHRRRGVASAMLH